MDDDKMFAQKIVIVEDNVALADIYRTRLDLKGYKCFVAHDGQEALTVIERERPDLVLLDLMVPKIAGDEILRRMRATSWGKETRVFIISNLNEEQAPAGLRDLNIEGYAIKANLRDDDIDNLVDKILLPAGQTDPVELSNTASSTVETDTSADNSAQPEPH